MALVVQVAVHIVVAHIERRPVQIEEYPLPLAARHAIELDVAGIGVGDQHRTVHRRLNRLHALRQKVNPHGARVGVILDWSTKWYAEKKDFSDNLVEDYQLRKMLKEKLAAAGIADIDIERSTGKLTVTIHTAKPGIVIGRGGKDVEAIKKQIETMTGKTCSLNIVEVKSPDTCAQLVAENIAQQLEKRVSFRRAMKQVLGRATKAGAKGIKTKVSGRLGGAEIARSEGYHDGSIPLQTLRANIDYGFAEAHTGYGRIGVKVWIYKGQVLPKTKKPLPVKAEGGR